MPAPVSRTRSSATPPAACAVTLIFPPAGVYLAALFSKLPITWASRVASASSHSRAAGSITSTA